MLISWRPSRRPHGDWKEVNGSGIYIPPSRTGNFRARYSGIDILVITQSELVLMPLPDRSRWIAVPRYFQADSLEVMAMPDELQPEIEVDVPTAREQWAAYEIARGLRSVKNVP